MAVTAEQLLEFMKEQAYKPMTYQELEIHFQLADAAEFRELLKLLNRLEEKGEIIRTRSNRYGVPERMNLIRGKIQVHSKGFGFLLPDDSEHPDVYIHANDLKGAMNGDTILARVTGQKDGARLEGEVARIVQRANTQIVGLYQDHGSFGFVIPDDRRIGKDLFVPKESSMGAVSGHKVVVDIVRYPEKGAAAEGEVVEILGHQNDPGVDILSIIRKYGIPEQFSSEVLQESEQIADTVHEEEIKGRRDLRDRTIVTIDGADAKDLDDAIDVTRLENGNIRLGVHIADVGYYVKENSHLDREAFRRGCSVYLIDRVIPMLPHRLSNGICSLHPHVDRLTLSCEMEINKTGRVVTHDIFPSVIRTTERMTYEDVRKILLDEDAEVTEKYEHLVDFFKLMETLATTLRKKRMGRGAIDFDFQEAKVLVNEDGDPIDIVKQERSISEQLIEEFMLVANETIAEHFYWLKIPFLYRIHEDPDAEKLQYFLEFITNFGLTVRGKGNNVHPRALQTLLEEVRDTKEETVISKMMLRSLKQAKYDAENKGHFGLSAEHYTHFTSPIRRYPDLVIHRMIREFLIQDGEVAQKRRETLEKAMVEIARQSSERERLAEDAERETEDLKKAEYMLDKIGEEFEGIVSGVTSFGIFIELNNTVEGLIRLSDMHDDYYHFHERQMALIGERTSKIFRIGDEVTIRVKEVIIEERQIEFELVDVKPREASEMDDALLAQARGRGGKPSSKKKHVKNNHKPRKSNSAGKVSVPDGDGGYITTGSSGKKRRKRKGKKKVKKR